MALDFLMIPLLLLLLLIGGGEFGFGARADGVGKESIGGQRLRILQEDRVNSSSRVAHSAWYPDTMIGPSSWEYFRVELPISFSMLTITLTRKRWTFDGKGPLVCFRFGGLPPIPSSPAETLHLAITKAGALQNTSHAGECGYFTETLQMNITNEEVVSGVLYIAAFSDTTSSRTQSKMISRGPTYKFDMGILVTVCDGNLVTKDCSHTINISPFSRLYSTTQFANKAANIPPGVSNTSWTSLNDCVDNSALSYFLLEIPDLVSALDIAIDTEGPVDSVKLFARHSALPQQENDEVMIQAGLATVMAPKRGSWYIGVKTGNSTGEKACFSLRWRIQACSAGYGGADCGWPSIMLERVVTRSWESPFDSKYVPAEMPVRSGWFTWNFQDNFTTIFNGTSSWLYYQLEVPKGAGGSVLTLQLRSTKDSPLEVYARSEGFPTADSFDSHTVSGDNKSLSFDILYPAEGIWSIGVMFSAEAGPDLKFHLTLHGCNNSCSHSGACNTGYDSSRLSFFSFCLCDRTHGGIDCSEKLLTSSGQSLEIFALVGSNAAAILPSFWALRQKAMSEWLVYTTSGISSAIYHSCDAGGWCAMSFDTLQFLDFWLSFLAVIFTFLYLAEALGLAKTTLHVAAAIVTAIIAKKDRTSAKSALAVIAIGAFGLLFGVLLEVWRQNPFRRLRGVIQRRSLLHGLHHRARDFLKKLRSKFIWAYIGMGLMIIGFAGLCWKQEQAKTYWIWHSLWHVSIYTGAFFLVFSVVETQIVQEGTDDTAGGSSGEIPAETDTFMNNNSSHPQN